MTAPRSGQKPAPRRLLSRVRDLMAGQGAAQERLDRLVDVIAADMVAEVCSIYLKRAGEVLELFATKGLKADAVHATRLRVGEGLVGDIAAHAKSLALADAQTHPNFVYRPETGEEIYHSLMGVPIMRGGRVIGVVVVQNMTQREYSEEEVEALETVAMVVAELVSSGELVPKDELIPADGIALLSLRIEGAQLNAGIGMGQAVLHQPKFNIEKLVSEDADEEQKRFRQALAEMQGKLDKLLNADGLGDGEHADVLETYRMFAEDAGWMGKIEEFINGGLTAEAAVQKVQTDMRVRMAQVTDPYLRERIHDLQDLTNRLLAHLMRGTQGAMPIEELPEHMVIVARNMGPAELLDYDRSRLRGLVLEEGTATSHVAIVAKALDIPVVGQVKNVLEKVETGEHLIVDGDNAQVFLRPGEDVQSSYKKSVIEGKQKKAAYASLRDVAPVSRDGIRIELNINAGLLVDLPHMNELGADGVGLYRTEVPFMVRAEFPDVEVQCALYRRIVEQCDGKPVVFRTLDIGGDKVLPYWDPGTEENPAMGWRAIRLSLDRPAMLRQQLRALLQAHAGRELRVMFPMVAEVHEFNQAKKLLELELMREIQRGIPVPSRIKIGVMMEVPSLMYQLDALLEAADFVSLGSNDMMQFLFASDRGNAKLNQRYDALSPLVFNFLTMLRMAADAKRKPLSVCGEMASKPLEALALIALGYRSLSVSPTAVGPIKAMVLSADVAKTQEFVHRLRRKSVHSVREALRDFALDHHIAI